LYWPFPFQAVPPIDTGWEHKRGEGQFTDARIVKQMAVLKGLSGINSELMTKAVKTVAEWLDFCN
jgi:hypothetical protein